MLLLDLHYKNPKEINPQDTLTSIYLSQILLF